MTNNQIIINEAIASGFYTKAQIEDLVSSGRMPQFHTYAIWKSVFGMVPKKGTHGWETKLWKKKNKTADKDSNPDDAESSDEEHNRDFYLTKSYLFDISQVEKLPEGEEVT